VRPRRYMTRRMHDKWAHMALFIKDIPTCDLLTSLAYSDRGVHLHRKAVAFLNILRG
jgi:hypothetical protein